MSETGLDTLLVGIDAGCLPVFRRLFEEDRIPTLESLCEDGFSAPMESQIPPWTPSAWPSIYTGVNPGKHGVYGFVTYDGYDWEVISADDVSEFTLWELLDREGLTSVVVNGPVTYPPPEIDGAVLPGFIGPEDPTCHPEGTLEDVREAIGGYRVYPAYHTEDESYTDAEKREEVCELITQRGAAFRHLADRHDPDFGFVQFQRPDTVFHEFEGDWDVVGPVYEATDEAIERVIDECDPDRVFVTSDHGMGEYDGCDVRVNDILRDEGYVDATRGGKGMPGWTPIRNQLREGETVETWDPSLGERVAAGVASVGLTASRVQTALERVGLAEVVGRYTPRNVSRTSSEQVDFESSRAYMRARTELGIRINLAEREPEGVVPPEEYESVRSDLVETLRAATTPDGEPVFQEVGPREEYFHGDRIEAGPDVVVVPNDFDHFISDQLAGERFGSRSVAWDHKRHGVFVAAGEGVDTEAAADPHLFDVAPTVLASLGIGPSDRMDGDVLPVVPSSDSQTVPDYEAATSDESAADVEDRLADLGYLQ
jgi:predicted AlkP superfamily phosphohydrolase/phosphomutase